MALVGLGLAVAVPATAQPALSRSAAVVVHQSVATPGTYSVSIVVASASRSRNEVEIHVGALTRSATVDPGHPRVNITLRLHLGVGGLTVRAVGRAGRPHIAVALLRVVAHPKPAVTATTPTPAPPPAPAPPPPPAPAAPPPSPQPPGPGSPYTNLVWSADFTQAWASTGATAAVTAPVPNTFGFDHSGGCSGNSAKEASYPASSNDAYLSSQGLVIPVNSTGPNSYTSAQLDSGGRESWQYGTIEASITLPTGAGLCPAFWLYADNGSGEIDILEAPSFVSPSYGPVNGPYAADSIFTLHANNAQEFERATTPPGWNPAGPNVYGIYWTPTSITWTVNYVPYASATQSTISNPSAWSAFTSGKFHIIFDDGVGGWPGDPASGTVYSQPMVVQWVKVFQ